MKKILATVIVLNITCQLSIGQSDPLYAQYMLNPLLINPAYTGFNNNLAASAMFRKQWAGFDGSPETFGASAHSTFRENGMGIGLIVIQDNIGASSNTDLHATYSYKLDLGDSRLSFGMQAGITSFRSRNSELNPYDPLDPAFAGNMNVTRPGFGAGVILNNERFFIGLSVPRMLRSGSKTGDVETELYTQHFYLSGAYILFISESVRLKPSALLRGVKGSSLSADVNVTINFDEKYSAGVFTRNFNTYGALVQMALGDSYRFGYAFEVPTNKSVGTRFTSHELTMTVAFSVFEFHDHRAVTTF